MAIKDDNRVIRSEKKDAIEELLNALNDENSTEATFKCKNCENNFKYEVNSKLHFIKHIRKSE